MLSAALAHPVATALSAGAACAYAALATTHTRASANQTRTLLSLAWVLHLAVLVLGLTSHPVRFGFAPALSVTAWLMLTVYLVESRLYPQFRARWTLALMGMGAVLIAFVFPGVHHPQLPSNWMPVHWALGISAYGLIAAAVVHAWLMQRAEKAMRLGNTLETAMPLLTLERLTFRFVAAGFVLLSATLVVGSWFSVSTGLGLMWNHKTALAVLSWICMGVLLLGRWRLGWRGRTAVRMLYLSASFLLLSYVGSRFVLEVVLQRI
jgi:ABC-type uncharacterized transport system permease subunit